MQSAIGEWSVANVFKKWNPDSVVALVSLGFACHVAIGADSESGVAGPLTGSRRRFREPARLLRLPSRRE